MCEEGFFVDLSLTKPKDCNCSAEGAQIPLAPRKATLLVWEELGTDFPLTSLSQLWQETTMPLLFRCFMQSELSAIKNNESVYGSWTKLQWYPILCSPQALFYSLLLKLCTSAVQCWNIFFSTIYNCLHFFFRKGVRRPFLCTAEFACLRISKRMRALLNKSSETPGTPDHTYLWCTDFTETLSESSPPLPWILPAFLVCYVIQPALPERQIRK